MLYGSQVEAWCLVTKPLVVDFAPTEQPARRGRQGKAWQVNSNRLSISRFTQLSLVHGINGFLSHQVDTILSFRKYSTEV